MNIEEIAKVHLKGLRNGSKGNVSAICPFHRKADGSLEKHPSFSLSLNTGLWHCWSCKAGGSFKKFLHLVGIDDYTIDTQYGQLLGQLRDKTTQVSTFFTVERQASVPEGILGVFDMCPLALIDEGFTEETLKHFEVGFDEKHMRITFPLRDIEGDLVGISGRTVINQHPRYKVYNYEYEQFGLERRTPPRLGELMWNLHNVYPAVFFDKEEPDLVLVEGFKACMWVKQSGINNVVALLGSSLSAYQEWVILRLGARIHLMLDNDNAGSKATKIIGDRLSTQANIRVVVYNEKQPDKCNNVKEVIDNAPNYFEWKVRNNYG